MDAKPTTRQRFTLEIDRENDGRWIAEIPKLPGVMAYGNTKQEAVRHARTIALRTLADSVEQGKTPAPVARLFDYGMARRQGITRLKSAIFHRLAHDASARIAPNTEQGRMAGCYVRVPRAGRDWAAHAKPHRQS